MLLAENDAQFHKVVAYTGAGTKLDAVTDFLAEGVKGVRRTQAVSAALRVFACGDVTAVAARFY